MSESPQYKILVNSCDLPEVGINILREKCEVIQCKHNGYEDETICKPEIEELIPGVHGILWCKNMYLSKDLLDKAGDQLKIVSVASAGVDNVDKAELKARGISISNTPGVGDTAVADMAILLMISAGRRMKEGIKQVENGKWLKGPRTKMGKDITGSTVGIIGLGGIGQMIAERLKGFDVRTILYTGHKEKEEGKELGAKFVSLNELLEQSDFIFLSCPLNGETKHLINENTISKMKKSAVLINVARGGIIDQEALIKALTNKRIFAAGLDVTTPEPLPKGHPLLSLDNCFISPHMASATVKTRNEVAKLAALNVILGVQNQPLLNPVF